MSGRLFVVATPIGNLEDITLRALRVLAEVDLVACEDTRVTRKLLARHGVEAKLSAYHAHSSPEVAERLLDRVAQGEDVALVSDAGTPLISDPGADLVRRAHERSLSVVPLPGPSAVMHALAGAGLPTGQFVFLGFMPKKRREQTAALAPYGRVPATLVLYESPHRAADTLATLREALGDRRACVARELSKRFETFHRGRLSALREAFEASPPKGELVILVGPAEDAEREDPRALAEAEARRLLADGLPPAQIAKTLAGAFALPRKAAYRLVLELKAAEG